MTNQRLNRRRRANLYSLYLSWQLSERLLAGFSRLFADILLCFWYRTWRYGFSKAPLILDTTFWTSFMQFLSFLRPVFSHLIPYCFCYMNTRRRTPTLIHELTIFSTSFTQFLSFNDFHFITVSVIWRYLLLQTTAVQPAEQHAPARPTRQNQLQGDLEETVREQIKIILKYGTYRYCASGPVLSLKSNSISFFSRCSGVRVQFTRNWL
jgi:hypothetical protein